MQTPLVFGCLSYYIISILKLGCQDQSRKVSHIPICCFKTLSITPQGHVSKIPIVAFIFLKFICFLLFLLFIRVYCMKQRVSFTRSKGFYSDISKKTHALFQPLASDPMSLMWIKARSSQDFAILNKIYHRGGKDKLTEMFLPIINHPKIVQKGWWQWATV